MKELLTSENIRAVFLGLLFLISIAEQTIFVYRNLDFIKECISRKENTPSIKSLMALMLLRVAIVLIFSIPFLGCPNLLEVILALFGFIAALMGLNTMEKKYQASNTPATPKTANDETSN